MEYPILTIRDGQIKGTQKTNLDGEKFYSFLGIPFGKAPVGKLRFKSPEPAEPWNGIKDATKEGNICYQRNELTRTIEGSEDCLNLHVFTKTLPSEEAKLKPVMVFIYGGAFNKGSNSTKMYGPEFLLTEDIVLVLINYRVGFLGFLHFDDTSIDVPGNAGLKDQQLALKWVQKNIINFNGDPQNVTIFGESAGSSSVHQHVLSSSSKGLFHKAILQSGVVLNSWAFCENNALNFAKSVDTNVETDKQALEVLQRLPIEELFKHQEEYYEAQGGTRVIAPNIEKPNKTAVVTCHPAELLSSGQYNKVPIMIGYCDREGMLFEFYKRLMIAAGKPPGDKYDKIDLDKFIPHEMNLEKDDPKRSIIKKKMMDLYMQPSLLSDKWLLASDAFFIAGIIGAAKLHAKTSSEPVYLYRVSLDADMNLLKKIGKITDKGVCHADELGYLFDNSVAAQFLQRGETEMKAVRRFVKLWTNFAKTGNPTPPGNDLNVEWKPVKEKQINFLDIGTEVTAQSDPESERMKVWKEIYQLSSTTSNYL